MKDGERNLRAEDKKGHEIFHGPIQTAEQRKELPGTLLARLEKFEAKLKEMGVTPGEDGGAVVTVRGHGLTAEDADKDKAPKTEKPNKTKKSDAKENDE